MGNSVIRTCTKCKEEKPVTDFYRANSKKSKNQPIGYKSHCKPCVLQQRREFYKTPHGRKVKIEHSWNSKGINCTVELFEEMFKAQNGKCAICGTSKNVANKAFCVDHDHKTGKIRGLLCDGCNTGIGMLQDSDQVLEKAVKYLKSKE